MERTHKEEYKIKRVKHGLDQADSCLDTVKGQLKKVEQNCREKEKWWNLATEQKKEIIETIEAKIENLNISLQDSGAREKYERIRKESVLTVARVSPNAWKEKCHELEIAQKQEQH